MCNNTQKTDSNYYSAQALESAAYCNNGYEGYILKSASLSNSIDNQKNDDYNNIYGAMPSVSVCGNYYNTNTHYATWEPGCSCDSIYNDDFSRRETATDKPLTNEGTEPKIMSYIHIVKANNYIVLASDSRSVIQNKDNIIIDFSDGFHKIVYLKKAKLGFACAGMNYLSNLPITEFLQNIDRTFCEEKSVKDRLQYFLNIIISKLPIDESISSENAKCLMNIQCGGYDHRKAVACSVDISDNSLVPQIHETSFICCAGYDKSVLKLFEDPNSKDKSLAKLSDLNTMLKFSDYMIKTEIERAEYIVGIPPVGGPIQTLLLTPDGEKWIHTLY